MIAVAQVDVVVTMMFGVYGRPRRMYQPSTRSPIPTVQDRPYMHEGHRNILIVSLGEPKRTYT
jgi:hypothetical protein